MMRISVSKARLKKWHQKQFNEGTEAYITKISDSIKVNENHVSILVKAINDNDLIVDINGVKGGMDDRS